MKFGVMTGADLKRTSLEDIVAVARRALRRIADTGVMDLNASILDLGDGGYARTFDFLAALRPEFSPA